MKINRLTFVGITTSVLGLSTFGCSGGSNAPTTGGGGGGGGGGSATGGTGGGDSSVTIGTGGGDEASTLDGGLPTDIDLIVDFEVPNDAGGPGILSMEGGRNGGWFVFDDGSLDVHPDGMPEAAIDPDAGIGSYLPGKMLLGNGLEEAMLDMPHDTFPTGMPSTKGLHVHGGPYRGSYGSGFGSNLNGSTDDAAALAQMPYDGSAYAGIIFFTKMAPSTQPTLRFSISTTESESGFGICEAAGCFNDFGVDLVMKTEWTAHVVRFSAMAQRTYKSYNPPGGFAKDKMISLKFTSGRGLAFDFLVDDIAFFK